MNRPLVCAFTVILALTGCGRKKVKARLPVSGGVAQGGAAGKTARARVPGETLPVGTTLRGKASWYGAPYNGRQAADGEIYDMETMVAAHRTLSFQTWVRVRNLLNDKTVDVRVIDRGPFVGGRIIDLSHAAAKQIELIGPGVAEVELTIIAAPPSPEPALFAVQVGAFREKANAEKMEARMIAAFGAAKIIVRPETPGVWRVLAGREPSEERAEALAKRVREEEKLPEAFVVRLDP
jgi:rare lipoprotein A